MDAALMSKIQKCLEVGRRGGTEAEMEAAMQRVHVMLAKYNLTMDEVEAAGPKPETVGDDADVVESVQFWHRYIYQAVSKLYFSGYFFTSTQKGKKRATLHHIIGKPSNVAVIKSLCSHLLDLGEALAKNEGSAKRDRNSFKNGFAARINSRCKEEIERAKRGEVKDESTCTALILSPLYDRSKREVAEYLRNRGVRLRGASHSCGSKNEAAFSRGWDAGGSVSLSRNGVSGGSSAARIGN